jgi:hypothetical protein
MHMLHDHSSTKQHMQQTENTMGTELYADGIGEITVTGSIVRIDFMSLSATERDEKNNPKAVFRQRVIMPVDAFANAVDLMQKALGGLVEAGAVRRVSDVQAVPAVGAPPIRADAGQAAAKSANASPNFN